MSLAAIASPGVAMAAARVTLVSRTIGNAATPTQMRSRFVVLPALTFLKVLDVTRSAA